MRATPTSKELRKPEVITPSQPSVSSPEIENGFIAETQGRASAGPFQNASAFTIYLTLSLLYWGPALLPHFSQSYLALGTVADPTILMWCIAWWPHAIANCLNPFITHVVWPPTGYNLVWTTSIPGPSLLTSPITRLFGPVVSHNILCLLCPAAAA